MHSNSSALGSTLRTAIASSSPKPQTLVQKVIITGLVVVLCSLAVIISVILIRSWRSNPWAFGDRLSSMRGRKSTGLRENRRKRYDGFQPLLQDSAQGLGSTCFSDEDEDDDDDSGSNTVVDIRNFGPPNTKASSLTQVAESVKPTIDGNTTSHHHIDT